MREKSGRAGRRHTRGHREIWGERDKSFFLIVVILLWVCTLTYAQPMTCRLYISKAVKAKIETKAMHRNNPVSKGQENHRGPQGHKVGLCVLVVAVRWGFREAS